MFRPLVAKLHRREILRSLRSLRMTARWAIQPLRTPSCHNTLAQFSSSISSVTANFIRWSTSPQAPNDGSSPKRAGCPSKRQSKRRPRPLETAYTTAVHGFERDAAARFISTRRVLVNAATPKGTAEACGTASVVVTPKRDAATPASRTATTRIATPPVASHH